MVEAGQRVSLDPSPYRHSDDDVQARAQARQAEARSGLVRGGTPPPSLDRETARALVEAGYMPLSDYVAIYGAEAEQRREPGWSLSVTARLTVAAPRRPVYRPTSVRCSLAKPSGRLLQWRRRA
jgi:hypothetical protein